MSIIGKFLFGWDHLEPVLLASLAKGHNTLLLGSHGCGKSSFARFAAIAVSEGKDGFRFIKYSMDKENLLSMVGCPNPEDMKKGKISYATHERSIFNANVVMLDELTRAGKENQNMVLEILEEKTVFGMPLKYQFAIATANEETYRGAYKLDAALLDRFAVVLPVPSAESKENLVGTEEISKMIKLNQGLRERNLEEANKKLVEAVGVIRQCYDEIWKNEKVMENINEFAAKFFSSLLMNIREVNKGVGKDSQIRISFRQISNQFVPLIVAISSYYKTVREDTDYIQNGAWDAIKYSIGTKLGYPLDRAKSIFDTLKDLLVDGDSQMTRVMISLTTGSIDGRISTLEKYSELIKKELEYADKTNIIGNILNEVDDAKPADLIQLIRLSEILAREKINEQGEHMAKLRLFSKAIGSTINETASFFA